MRLGVIGDVHGHREELELALSKVAEHQVDRIILLGDLVDRGPDDRGCIKVAREWTFVARCGQRRGLDVVMGNHEDAYVRAHRGLPKPGRVERCEPGSERLARRLTLDELLWMESLPYVIAEPRLGVLCVHGGIDHHMLTPGDLDARVARVRYVDASGRAIGGYARSNTHWSDIYDGRFGFVVYGHESWHKPRLSRHALGVDGEGFQRVHAAILTNETSEGLRVTKTVTVPYRHDPLSQLLRGCSTPRRRGKTRRVSNQRAWW